MRYLLFSLILFCATVFGEGSIPISQLPLLTGSQVGINDTFPFVSVFTGTTSQLAISQLFQVPALQNPTFPSLGILNPAAGGATVTLLNPGTTGAYNFNLPITAGTSGQILTSQGGGAAAMIWTNPLTNPMTTEGDIIYGGDSSGDAYRLAANASGTNKYLQSASSGDPAWVQVAFGDLSGTGTMNTNGILYATSSTQTNTTTVGTAGQVLTSNGTGVAPTLQTVAGNATILTAPTTTVETSTGTAVGYIFTVTLAAAVNPGCVFTNNGATFTVIGTYTSAATLIWATNPSGTAAASGTLTYSSGATSGNICNKTTSAYGANITFTASQTFATYTTPTNPSPLYLKIRMVGGGGGGGGTGTSGATSGGGGGITSFGTNSFVANGGAGGGASTGAAIGTSGGGAQSSGGTLNLTGGNGQIGPIVSSSGPTSNEPGGNGASSAFGGAGAGEVNSAGYTGKANTGSGGSGGGGNSSVFPGTGGGAGAYLEGSVNSPAATYYYSVGTAGTLGAAGTSGNAGAAGGAGVIYIEEKYQ